MPGRLLARTSAGPLHLNGDLAFVTEESLSFQVRKPFRLSTASALADHGGVLIRKEQVLNSKEEIPGPPQLLYAICFCFRGENEPYPPDSGDRRKPRVD